MTERVDTPESASAPQLLCKNKLSRNRKKQRQRENKHRLRSAREHLLSATSEYLKIYARTLTGNRVSRTAVPSKSTKHIEKLIQAHIAKNNCIFFMQSKETLSAQRADSEFETPQTLPARVLHTESAATEPATNKEKEQHPFPLTNSAPEPQVQFRNSLKTHPLIVLYRPEIPPNTGTIARLCAAFRMPLVLIGPLGFDVSEKAFRRAGLDYWPWVDIFIFANWQAFLAQKLHKRLVFIETSGKTPIGEYQFQWGDALVFGSETKGIPAEVLEATYSEPSLEIKIPMWQENVRSINIANSVSIAASRALHWAPSISHKEF